MQKNRLGGMCTHIPAACPVVVLGVRSEEWGGRVSAHSWRRKEQVIANLCRGAVSGLQSSLWEEDAVIDVCVYTALLARSPSFVTSILGPEEVFAIHMGLRHWEP